MISVEQAKEAVLKQAALLDSVYFPLKEALGHVLANPVTCPLDLPPFPRSAMDGYILPTSGTLNGQEFQVVGTSSAGANEVPEIGEGEALRVYTGAPVPPSGKAVLMQEKTRREGDRIVIETDNIEPGANIRQKGEELAKGEPAMDKGTLITPAGLGFLASMGLDHVQVHRKPNVALLVTGDELTEPGNERDAYSIYESNSYALGAALQQNGFSSGIPVKVPDDLDNTEKCIRNALKEADVLVATGGISVGDRDHVKEALERTGNTEFFHKIAQKPGKPVYFGGWENGKVVFGLPGNPAACLTSYYEYVLPFLRKCSGYTDPFLPTRSLPLKGSWKKKGDRALFLKGQVLNDRVIPLDKQSSAMMASFAIADALIYIPANKNEVADGEEVEVHLIREK